MAPKGALLIAGIFKRLQITLRGMTTPLPPGWYPHPDGRPDKLYWDGQQWHNTPPPAPNEGNPNTRKLLLWAGVALVAVLAFGRCSGWGSENEGASTSTTASTTTSATTTTSTPMTAATSPTATTTTNDTSTTSTEGDPWEYVSDDGVHDVGSTYGMNWGTWVSDGADRSGTCQWSVRLVSPAAPAEILDSGEAGVGEEVRVSILPLDGDPKIVFVTYHCLPWRWVGI